VRGQGPHHEPRIGTRSTRVGELAMARGSGSRDRGRERERGAHPNPPSCLLTVSRSDRSGGVSGSDGRRRDTRRAALTRWLGFPRPWRRLRRRGRERWNRKDGTIRFESSRALLGCAGCRVSFCSVARPGGASSLLKFW
jgi:hypothetical protein